MTDIYQPTDYERNAKANEARIHELRRQEEAKPMTELRANCIACDKCSWAGRTQELDEHMRTVHPEPMTDDIVEKVREAMKRRLANQGWLESDWLLIGDLIPALLDKLDEKVSFLRMAKVLNDNSTAERDALRAELERDREVRAKLALDNAALRSELSDAERRLSESATIMLEYAERVRGWQNSYELLKGSCSCLYCTATFKGTDTVEKLQNHIENECQFHPIRQLRADLAAMTKRCEELVETMRYIKRISYQEMKDGQSWAQEINEAADKALSERGESLTEGDAK